jgi:hypothetical protein
MNNNHRIALAMLAAIAVWFWYQYRGGVSRRRAPADLFSQRRAFSLDCSDIPKLPAASVRKERAFARIVAYESVAAAKKAKRVLTSKTHGFALSVERFSHHLVLTAAALDAARLLTLSKTLGKRFQRSEGADPEKANPQSIVGLIRCTFDDAQSATRFKEHADRHRAIPLFADAIPPWLVGKGGRYQLSKAHIEARKSFARWRRVRSAPQKSMPRFVADFFECERVTNNAMLSLYKNLRSALRDKHGVRDTHGLHTARLATSVRFALLMPCYVTLGRKLGGFARDENGSIAPRDEALSASVFDSRVAGSMLELEVIFRRVKWGLPALMRALCKAGCQKPQYTLLSEDEVRQD